MSLKTGVKLPLLVLLATGLLGAGVLVRAFSGVAILSTDLVYISGNEPISDIPNIPDTPESTARLFFLSIDSGDYEQAWRYSREPDWLGDGSAAAYREEVVPTSSVPAGWTGKEAFVARMNLELGKSGYGIRLNNVEAVRTPPESVLSGPAFPLPEAEELIPVTVTGHLLGACTIFGWEKNLFVVNTGDGYQVLLDGTKEKKSLYYQTWISDIKKIGDLRKGSPQ